MLPQILFLCVFFFFCSYLYIKKCQYYWKYRGVITVDTHFLFGIFFDNWMGRRSLTEIFKDIYESEPDAPYVGVYHNLDPVLFIRDPELIHTITVKNFDNFRDRAKLSISGSPETYRIDAMEGKERWKLMRTKALSAFSSSTVGKMYKQIEEAAKRVIEMHHSQKSKVVDVNDEVSRFALNVTSEYILGVWHDDFQRILRTKRNYSPFKEIFMIILDSLSPYLMKFFDGGERDFFFNLTHDVEQIRRKERREDFFQFLLDMKDNATRDNADIKSSCTVSEKHVIVNIAAGVTGYENIACLMAFTLYELAMQPDVQEKLRWEIQKAREANDGIMDSKIINEIAYLEMVICEAFRLHCPVPFSGRTCTKNYKLPGSALEIKVGQQVIYPFSALHRDARFFPDPLKFDPDRFSVENRLKMNPHAYLPFGSGPRYCIAKRFIHCTIKIYLVSILLRFKLSPCNRTEVPIILQKEGMLHAPENGIWLAIEDLEH